MPESVPQGAQAPAEPEIHVSTSDVPAAPAAPPPETPPPAGTPAQETPAAEGTPAAADVTPAKPEPDAAATRDSESPAKRIAKLTRRLRDQERETARVKVEAAYERGVREGYEKATGKPAAEADPKPKLDDFDSAEDYAETLADWKVRQKEAAPEKPAGGKAEADDADDLADPDGDEPRPPTDHESASFLVAKAAHPDLEAVIFDSKLGWTLAIVDAATDLDHPVEVLYQLGKQPAELKRILALSPRQMRRELIRFEDKLPAAPTKASADAGKAGDPQAAASTLDDVPNAPDQPGPVTGRATGKVDYAKLSTEDYLRVVDREEAEERRIRRR